MKKIIISIILGFVAVSIFWALSVFVIAFFALKFPVFLWDATWLLWPISSFVIYKKLKRKSEAINK